MARPKPASEQSSGIGNIIFWVFIVGVGIMFGWKFLVQPPDDEVKRRLLTAETAMMQYFKIAGDMQTQSGNFMDFAQTVRKQDYEWWQANYQEMDKENDAFDISSAIDPQQAVLIARFRTIADVSFFGPHTASSQVLERKVGATTAEFLVRRAVYYDGFASYHDCRVGLVKEGRFWRVVDFAGGRANKENRLADSTRVSISEREHEIQAAKADPLSMAIDGPPPEGVPSWMREDDDFYEPPGGLSDEQKLAQADALIQQARALFQQERYAESIQIATQAKTIYIDVLGQTDPKVAQVEQVIQAVESRRAQQ